MPTDIPYEGWYHTDWYFTNDTVESLIARRQFNKNLAYMSGITTQEAAYVLCEYKVQTFFIYILKKKNSAFQLYVIHTHIFSLHSWQF